MKKISLLTIAFLTSLTIQATVVDTLTSGSVAPYTTTIILAQNGDGPMTLASSGSGLQVSRVFSSGGAAQQDLFLRNDFSLSVGNTLSVSLGSLGTSAFNADFGIAIGSQVNPVSASPWVSGTLSTRSNFLAVYVKPGSSQVGSVGFNGLVQLATPGIGVNTPGAGVYSTINGLWITETAANIFSLGYTTPSGDVTLSSGITFTGASVDNSIGFYADLRATGSSPVNLLNLSITPAPEPSTLAMFGLGFAGLVVAIRRRK
jgi:hypothetical protein